MIPSPCWYVLVVVAAALGRTHAQACTRPVHPLAGFTGHLEMRSRQLRGTVTVVDACRFDVTGLEVSPGSELQWRGAQGSTAAEVAAGTVVVGAAVSGNISAGSVQGTLLPGVFWDDFAVLTLFSPRTGLTAAVLKLQVGPATTQLTMFDSCQHLTPDVRVRWTVRNDAVEFGLEGLVDPGTAMSFGHNDPAVTNRLMGQADATVVGYDAAGTAAYATDYYLGSYVECHNPDASGAGVDGVCEDASHGGGAALDNVELLYAQRMDGVTLIRYRKPLVAADLWDHDITAHAPQSFIWALSNTGLSNQFRFQTSPSIKYHGVYNWGELPDMVLSTPRFDCAPLAGVMEAQDASSPPSPPADPASILLHAGRVRLTWTLGADDTIAFHVEAFRSSRYLAVAMGTEMKGAYAYVAWFDDDDTGHLNSYTMSGHNARDVQLVSETLSDVEVERSAEGVLSFRFSRPLVRTAGGIQR